MHLFRRARNDEDTPGDAVLDDAEFERQVRHQWPLYENLRWYAWSGDDIVRAHWRRQGVATKLLRPVLDLMRERNKTVATFDTSVSYGHAFLTAIGATLKHRQIESRAPLSGLDWATLEVPEPTCHAQ